MRVLMYGWEFPPHISGGLGVACFGMTQALVEKKHNVTFVVPKLKHGMKESSHVNLVSVGLLGNKTTDVNVNSIKELKQYITLNTKKIDMRAIDSPLSPYLSEEAYEEVLRNIELQKQTTVKEDIATSKTTVLKDISGDYGPNLMKEVMRYAAEASNFADAVEHDIIHAHDWLTMLAGVFAKKKSGKPLVVHAHALEFDRSGDNVNQTIYDIERYGMHEADHVIAVSHLTKEIIVERYAVDPKKVSVVHNALTRLPSNSNHEGKSVKEKVVLFLGRITFQKGPDYFVEAAAKVLKVRDDVRFVMAGSGDMTRQMIERVAELKLGRKFHFTGFLTGTDVERMYKESDVYVMPSVSEPFGISPLEAMYNDVPVIISKQSGVSEVLTHALKVDFWDTDALANQIIALLSHPSLTKELVAQGAKELEHIQWTTVADKLTHVYEELKN